MKLLDKPKVGPSKKISFQAENIEVNNLLLDPNNYRFLDNLSYKKKIKTKFHLTAVQETTLRLLEQEKSYQLAELKRSILANGYVPMERIIVVPYKYASGKYLVVEGNRRVAALKSLLQESKEAVRDLTEDEIKSFSKIPCAILEGKDSSLAHAERVIMGIRHIAGPKEWGAYQQAQLISELHDQEGEEFSKIGEHLGISTVEVARRYRAMRALKSMEEDLLYASSSAPSFYRLFHELVSLPDVRKRFGWEDDSDNFSNANKAREFFELIAPQTGEEAKLKTYSDVRKLKLIVGRSKAEAVLFDPDHSFAEALKLADLEISQEEHGELSITELCKDLRLQITNIKITDLTGIKKADLNAINQLIIAAQNLKETVARQVNTSNEPAV